MPEAGHSRAQRCVERRGQQHVGELVQGDEEVPQVGNGQARALYKNPPTTPEKYACAILRGRLDAFWDGMDVLTR